MTPTPAELLTELKASIVEHPTLDLETAKEWCRALDVVVAAHVAASQSAAEGGGATMTEDVRCHLSLALGHAIGRGVTVPQFDEFVEQLAKRGLVVAALRGAGGK